MGELSDIVLHLEPSLGPVGGEPAPLEGGITNRNFRVRFAQDEYVVRLHGKDTDLLGISREAERIASDTAAALGIAPEVVADFKGGVVTRFVCCDAMDSRRIAMRAPEIARALRAFHDSGIRLPVDFVVPQLLAGYAAIIRDRGERPPGEYGEMLDAAERIAAALPGIEPRPCHNDLLAGNILALRDGKRVMLVDWEYAGMGDPYFDLGNLSVNNRFGADDDERLLHAYLGAPASPAQAARLWLMRVMSDAREAAWGVMQGQLSTLDFDFGGYAGEHFRRLREAVGGADFERQLDTAAAG